MTFFHTNTSRKYMKALKMKWLPLVILWVISFLTFTSLSIAQSDKDSLNLLLKNSKGKQRVEILLKLSSENYQFDIEKAIDQAEKALSIAKSYKNTQLIFRSYAQLGFFNYMSDQDITALSYYLNALKLARQQDNSHDASYILNKLGRLFASQGNHVKALNYYFQALKIQQEEGNKDGASITLQCIGLLYSQRGKYQKAVSYYKKSYEISNEIRDLSGMTMAACNVAYAMQELKNYDEAIIYYKKALSANSEVKDEHSIHGKTAILLGMSSVYKNQKLYKKSLALLHKQIKIAKTNKSKMLVARGLEQMAKVYKVQGNLGQASSLLKKTITLKNELGTSTYIDLNNLAQNYLDQGLAQKAVVTAKKALVQARESGSFNNEKVILKTLINAYTAQENYQAGLQAQIQLTSVNNRIFDKISSKQIAEMQTRYETEKKEQAITLLEKKQEKATLLRNVLLIGLGLLIIIALLIFNRQRLKIAKDKTSLENTRLKQQQLKRDLEFKNKQLTTHSLNLVQKNEVMQELKQRISDMQNSNGKKSTNDFQKLSRLIDYSFNLDKDWEEFRLYFEEVHTDFFKVLKERSPDLTTSELRLSALVKLNLTIREIATIMSISPSSVKTARYRLRKKLDLDTDQDLGEFMMNIETQVVD